MEYIPVDPKGITLEKDFQTAMWREWKKMGFFYYKLTDASMGRKPFDCVVSMNWRTYCVELKVIKGLTFNPSVLRDHQVYCLKQIEKNWARAMVLVYSLKAWYYKIYSIWELQDDVSMKF